MDCAARPLSAGIRGSVPPPLLDLEERMLCFAACHIFGVSYMLLVLCERHTEYVLTRDEDEVRLHDEVRWWRTLTTALDE